MLPPTDGPSYGEAFADVYDRWYPDAGRAATVVAALGRPGGNGRLLELGVGTGTLALPLAAAGWQVAGLDDSPAMLERLARRHRPATPGSVQGRHGDAADPATWPAGPFRVVLAGSNLVANLRTPTRLDGLLHGAAAVLDEDGRLVVEADEPVLPHRRTRRVTWAGVAGDAVRVHTDVDPATRLVEGRHVIHTGGTLRVRRWRLRLWAPAELDERAVAAGLVLDRRTTGWVGDHEDGPLVSWYRRVSPRPGAPAASPPPR